MWKMNYVPICIAGSQRPRKKALSGEEENNNNNRNPQSDLKKKKKQQIWENPLRLETDQVCAISGVSPDVRLFRPSAFS